MANNYEQSTVTPTLPKTLFTDLELETLASFGMSYETATDDHLYFYSEESSWGNDLDIDPDTYVAMLQDKTNYVVAQYLDYFEANDIQKDEANVITVNLEDINDDTNAESELTVETIFRSILRKPECDIEEIVIMGAFTCDKMRQGEFGGFVTRITKDIIQHNGTYQVLEEMRNPETIHVGVIVEGGVIQGVVSDTKDNLSIITIDYDTDGHDEDDLTAVKQSDGKVEQAYCVHEYILEPVINLVEIETAMDEVKETWRLRNQNTDKRMINQGG